MAARYSINSLTGDGKMEKDPRKRHSNTSLPPNMSELRIVLLGRSGELKCKVGNIILRREAFETQTSFFTGKQQCERSRGLVDGRHVTVTNTPDLLHPQITQHEIDKQVELCVSLSDPGPHVLLLVLQPDRFTERDRDRMKTILTTFVDHVFEHTMVLVIHEDKTDVCTDEQNDSIGLLIEECRGRCHKFNNINKTDRTQIVQFMEQINTMVKENEERYLTCEIYQEVESGATSIPDDWQTRCAQDVARDYEPQSHREKDTREENVDISNVVLQKRRESFSYEPPEMSELRIVLLGRSGEVKCKVGNIILRRDAFSVRDQCERKRTVWNGKHVAVINTPDLLDPELPDRTLFHHLETCVRLSVPGPHAYLLVLQDGQFAEGDKKRLKRILGFFSVEAFEYSVVLVIRSNTKKFSMNLFSVRKDLVQKVVKKCNGRSYSFNSSEEINLSKVTELMKKVEQMVQENGGGFLNCEIFEEPESEVLGAKGSSVMGTELKKKWKPQPGTQQEMEGERLNLVVFGRRGAGKTSTVNAILGQKESSVDPSPSSVYESREGEVCGRLVTVVELPALCEAQLSTTTVSHLFTSFCGPGVHAFLMVTPAGSLTDEDKAEITRINKIFGSRVTDYMMVLFITESPTAQPVPQCLQQDTYIQEFLKICGNRHFVFNNQKSVHSPVVPEFLKAVEEMNKATKSCFTLDMYWEAQLEEKNRKIRELEGYISGTAWGVEGEDQSPACMRIALLGKTGSGKSATGNTILQRKEFLSQSSMTSVTTSCKKEAGDVAGRRVAVVDTPGLFDTSLTNEAIQEEITKCISFLAPGPHVFLLVLQIGRITKEETDALQLIKETFGKAAEMFTIIMFTRGDDLDRSIDEFIESGDPTIQKLIQDCGGRFHVFNNKDKSNVTQVTKLLDKIDMMVQKNGGGCYTNKMFQEAERTIKKKCERILREREGEMLREKEKLKVKHEEEMGELKRRMEEQQRTVEEERARQEKELKEKEENLKREIEALKERELEANERREEDQKKWESQELEWKSKIDEKEREKCRIKEELQRREEEEKKRLETEEKERQELIQKQKREKQEFEERVAEEKKKRDRDEQERRSREERERREWEERIKESEKEKKEIREDMKKKAEEWELQREKERLRKQEEEIYRKQKEEQERRERKEKQKKMRDEFENKIKQEKNQRMNEIRAKEKIQRELEEERRQIEKEKEKWEKERREEKERRDGEDQRREKEKQDLLKKLQEEQEESLRRKREHEAREEAARKQCVAMERDHKREIKEIEQKFKHDARKQAEQCTGFGEEFLKLEIRVEDLAVLKQMRAALKDEKHAILAKYLDKKIKEVEEKSKGGCTIM